MKNRYSLLILLFVLSSVQAQNNSKYTIQSRINHGLPSTQLSNKYECIAPTDFDVHVYETGYDQYMLYLTWDMQNIFGEWLHWDDGVHHSGIGCCYDISASVRWDSGQLVDYHNLRIAKMRVILNDTYNDSLVFKIWNGAHEANLIYHDTIHEFYAGSWIEHELESEIFINSNEELYVGYTALHMPAGTFTLGTDEGPAIAGYGDLIRPDNNYDWDLLSDYGLEYNWNIQFYAEDTSGNQIQFDHQSEERGINLLGYNLWQSTNDNAYELLEFIPYESDSNYYALPLEASFDTHCFKLTALWTTTTDTCESAPAVCMDNPESDSLCVLLVNYPESNSETFGNIRCSPNPFTNSTTINYELTTPQNVTISFYNQFGKQVNLIEEQQSAGKQQMTWKPKGLPDGIYYFRIEAGEMAANGKLILLR